MERDIFDVLGENVLQEMAVGFDYSSLITATANVAKTGVDQYQSGEAKKQAAKDSEAAVKKSIEADAAWANAEMNLELAGVDPTAAAASRVVRDGKKKEADIAAGALQADGITKRAQAAQDQLSSVEPAAKADPKNVAKQAKLHAWQKVVAASGAVPTPEGAPASEKTHGGHGGGFAEMLTSRHAGLPVWGWGLVGVGGLAALIMILRRKK